MAKKRGTSSAESRRKRKVPSKTAPGGSRILAQIDKQLDKASSGHDKDHDKHLKTPDFTQNLDPGGYGRSR